MLCRFACGTLSLDGATTAIFFTPYCRHRCSCARRGLRGNTFELLLWFGYPTTSGCSLPAYKHVLEQVRAVLDRLDCHDRTLLEPLYIARLSVEKIGGRLGIGSSAVKMRPLRALERIHSLLELTAQEPSS